MGQHDVDLGTPTVELGDEMFKIHVAALFQYLQVRPDRLEENHSEKRKQLNKSCGNGQGLGNKASHQEACFAVIAEGYGFLPYRPNTDGYFYKYQLCGTQRAIDFQLLEVVDGVTVNFVNVDLKHGDAQGIFLNDGTFLDDVVYVVSFSRKVKVEGQRKMQKQNVCAIFLGQHAMTEKDKARMEEWRSLIRKMNKQTEQGDFLILYARSANRYDCKQFTNEYILEKSKLLFSWLLPSLPQTAQGPHSQSVESHP